MDITITKPSPTPPTPYANSLSITIRSFKGRRDVEVHLFRGSWDKDEEEAQDWAALITPSPEADDPSRSVVMESFTDEERDRLINYLKDQYSTRLTAIRSIPLPFPVPSGMPGLSKAQPGKSIGLIEFTKIPSYPLEIPLMGLYDLNQHPPLVDE